MCIIGITYICIFVPESPLFYYGKKRYAESRESMKVAADMNAVAEIKGKPYD